MIRFVCPECETSLKVADDKAGARIACPRCKTSVKVPGSKEPAAPVKKKKPVVLDDLEDLEELDDEEPERGPKGKSKKSGSKKKGMPVGAYIGIAVGGFLVVAVGGGIIAAKVLSNKEPEVAQGSAATAPPPAPAATQSIPPAVAPTPTAPEVKPAAPPATTEKPPAVATPKAPATGSDNVQINVNTDPKKIADRLRKSSVFIVGIKKDSAWMGSGSLVDRENRLILTNNHVVKGPPGGGTAELHVFFPIYEKGELVKEKDAYMKRLRKGGEDLVGWSVATKPDKDLALIQLTGLPDGVQALPVAGSSVDQGDAVYQMGNPGVSDAVFGFTSGSVRMAHHANIPELNLDAEVVETNLATNPGDSGSAVVNGRCELVAVTQSGVVGANAMTMFVDVSEVRTFINEYYKSHGINKTLEAGASSVLPTDTSQLVNVLQAREPKQRARAAAALGQLGPAARRAVPSLVKALKDQDPDVRKNAAEALEVIGSLRQSDVPDLCAALKEDDPDVKKHVVAILKGMGRSAAPAVPSLVEALKDSDLEVRKNTIAALGKLGPDAKPAVNGLAEALTDPDLGARAAEALAKLGPVAKPAVPKLIEALNSTDSGLRASVLMALEAMGPDAKPALPKMKEILRRSKDQDVLKAAISAVAALGPDARDAVAPLVFLLGERDLHTQLEDAFGKIGKDAVPELIKVLKDPNGHVRLGAVNALGAIGPDAKTAVRALKINYNNDPEPSIRLAANEALKKIQEGAK